MTRSSSRPNQSRLSSDSDVPDKLYFKIGEVSQLVGVQPHVLRYWEKEISAIRPGKTASNQRRYRRKDVDLFREIRRLLYEEKFTLAGARKRLLTGERGHEDEPRENPTLAEIPPPEILEPLPDEDNLTGGQIPLSFNLGPSQEHIEKIRHGLRELIRLAGEDP